MSRPTARMVVRGLTAAVVLLVFASWVPLDLAAQEAEPRTASPSVPSARGAFFRSLAVPGWGQAAFGAYFRGGVYFAAQGGSWYMLLKTQGRIDEAADLEARRVAAIRAGLEEAGVTDPSAIAAAVDGDALVQGFRELVSTRRNQREDWIAQVLFWTLASALDAFVTAHLYDFPARVSGQVAPGGEMRFGVSVPVGGPR